MINEQKSLIFFNSNTKVPTKNSFIKAIKGKIFDNYDHYLGLLAFVGRSKYNNFQWIKEKVWQRVANRKHKLLSQVRHKVLIKAGLQDLLVFTMSFFHLPQVLCCKHDSLMARYWWGQLIKTKNFMELVGRRCVYQKREWGSRFQGLGSL